MAILESLEDRSLADGNPAWNGFCTAQQWADIFVDDRIQVDIKKAQTIDYLTIELRKQIPDDWNVSAGRRLEYDVHEVFFNLMITRFDPSIEDGLEGNDLPLLEKFPFPAASLKYSG